MRARLFSYLCGVDIQRALNLHLGLLAGEREFTPELQIRLLAHHGEGAAGAHGRVGLRVELHGVGHRRRRAPAIDAEVLVRVQVYLLGVGLDPGLRAEQALLLARPQDEAHRAPRLD